MLKISPLNHYFRSFPPPTQEDHRHPGTSVNRIIIGPETLLSVENRKIPIGERPAYFIGESECSLLLRTKIDPVAEKKYLGYDRLIQSLRHLAISINTTMKIEMGLDPLEVQASVFGNKLHISSNFHSDKILEALRLALRFKPSHNPGNDRVQARDIKSWDIVIAARRIRHMNKLIKIFPDDSSRNRLDAVIEKSRREINSANHFKYDINLDRATIAKQCKSGFETMFSAMMDMRERGLSHRILIHHPFKDPNLSGKLPHGVTETRHAELNIEEYLAENSDHEYANAIEALGMKAGQHVIVTMAGRFVPCAICSEIEHSSIGDGFFAPQNNQFVLMRSSDRIGKAFTNEVQHFPLRVLSKDKDISAQKALHIRDSFLFNPEKLRSYNTKVVDAYSLDTDSEDSD
jgi:hypothetical protein